MFERLKGECHKISDSCLCQHSSLGPYQGRYIYLSKREGTPPSSSDETPFPCLYNCTMGSWQLYRQTATAVYTRQSSYTDRGKASQFMYIVQYSIFFGPFTLYSVETKLIYSILSCSECFLKTSLYRIFFLFLNFVWFRCIDLIPEMNIYSRIVFISERINLLTIALKIARVPTHLSTVTF